MLRTLPNRGALSCKATLKHVNKLILGHSYSVASYFSQLPLKKDNILQLQFGMKNDPTAVNEHVWRSSFQVL